MEIKYRILDKFVIISNTWLSKKNPFLFNICKIKFLVRLPVSLEKVNAP